MVAEIDEATLKNRNEKLSPTDLAVFLASEKALAVSTLHPNAAVIGADQTLSIADRMLDKSADRAEAREHLLQMRGRRHTLHAAVVVVIGGAVVWRHIDSATLTMRPFSDSYLNSYLDEVGDDVLSSVGCYHLEGRGAQLFSEIDGDFFTVLGLPLLPLLAFLRDQKIIAT